MKKTLLLICAALLITSLGNAQTYKWVKGGGSSCSLTNQNSDRITAMCTDGNRNVYAIAMIGGQSITADTFYRANTHYTSNNCNEPSTLILSYNACGQMRWAKLYDTYGTMLAADIKYDNMGSIYVVGFGTPNYNKYFGDTTVTSPNLGNYIIKYDTSGKMQWMRFLGANNLSNQLLVTGYCNLAIDGSGRPHYYISAKTGLVLNSTVTTQAGIYDIMYSPGGALQSATRLPLDSDWQMKKAFIAPSGNLYAIMFHNIFGAYNTALMKFSPSGNMIWSDTTGSTGGVNGFAYDGSNNIYVVGTGQSGQTFHFAGQTASNSYYPIYAYATITKVDTNGNGKWINHYDCSQSAVGFNDVSMLPNGNLAAAGLFTYTLRKGVDSIVTPASEGQNPCMLIADSAGNTLKLDQLHGNGFYDWGTACTADNVGNFYIGGQFESNITATGLGNGITSTGGNTDFYIMKYGYVCNCAAPTANFTSGIASGRTVSYTYAGTTTSLDSLVWNWGDGQKQKVITGFTSPISHTFAANGKFNVCVTAYTQCGVNSFCKQTPLAIGGIASLGDVKVYPNPANGSISIEGAAGAIAAFINPIGQQAIRIAITASRQSIDISVLPAGVYLLQLTDAQGNRGATSIVKE